MTDSKYYIDFIYDVPAGQDFYHQLVRRSDNAILCAHTDLDSIFLFCFHAGISKNDLIIL